MSAVIEGFIPPHSIEAEMCVLGSMFLSEQACEVVRDLLSEHDFYRPAHRTIFRAVVSLLDQSRTVDLVTVSNLLGERDQLQQVGGQDYLIQIAEAVPSAAAAADYAKIVHEKATLRRLEQTGHEIIQLVHDPERELEDKVDRAEQLVHLVGRRKDEKKYSTVQDEAREFRKALDELYESGKPILGRPSGLIDLDAITGGLYGGDMVIVAARPAMGKTSLVLGMGANVAAQRQGAVMVFSLEMTAQQLVRRLVSSRSQISMGVLKKPNLSDQNYDRLLDACEELYDIPMVIDDKSDITPFEMRSKCRRVRSEHGLSLVIVDYLQLMRGSRKTENRVQEVGEIARSLKGLAKELNVPVIALSQLSRTVEQRPDKRPMLSDIRESGSIEAEADLVMFIYRDSYYRAKEEGLEQDYNPESVEEAELIIAKHRNGPTGKVIVGFQPAFARFVNLKR